MENKHLAKYGNIYDFYLIKQLTIPLFCGINIVEFHCGYSKNQGEFRVLLESLTQWLKSGKERGFIMKKFAKWCGFFAFVAVIGFSMVACKMEEDNGNDYEKLNGVWDRGDIVVTFNNDTAVFTQINSGDWKTVKDKGIIGIGYPKFKNISRKGDLEWTCQTLVCAAKTLDKIWWVDCTLTMYNNGNGQSLQSYTPSNVTPYYNMPESNNCYCVNGGVPRWQALLPRRVYGGREGKYRQLGRTENRINIIEACYMKKILLLTTGGTIASMEGGNGLKPMLSGEDLLQCIPEAAEICELKSKPVIIRGSSKGVDSSNIQPEDWVEIAKAVFAELENCDGIVITHGTDTMAYTSSMLSFMLTDLNKPVILTGSQKPMDDPFTDAKKNLLDAVRTAVEGYPGIYIVFGGRIIKGTNASKVHTTENEAFDSINAPLSGVIKGKDVVMEYPLPPGEGGAKLDTNILTKVYLLKLTPGINPDIIDEIVNMGYKGIVIEVFGLGGIPNEVRGLLGPIRKAIKNGVSIVAMTQSRNGITDFERYEVGKKALKAGIIPVSNMTVEAAFTKLMRVLSHTTKPKKVKKKMQKDLVVN